MYWQRSFLRKGSTFTRNDTWREDLPKSGLLGSILFQISGPGVTDSMNAIDKWRMIDYISKLEIVGDGSTPIKSLTGQVAHYLAWLDGGGAAPDQHFNYGSGTKRCHLLMNFGRHLFDPDYGLDLSKWRSVEIKATNDASSTYFGGDLSIDVLCYYLREAAGGGFKGYFRTEEWRKWTTVAGEKVYLELPTENLVRRVALQVIPDLDSDYNAETTPYNVAYDIELYLRTGILEVWKSGLRDLWYENYFNLGRDVIQPLQPYHTDGKGIWTGLGQSLSYAGLRIPHDSTQDTASTSLSPGEDSSTQKRFTDTDADQDALLVMGLALENCAAFRFDMPDQPEGYLDPLRDATVQLNIETRNAATAADGTIRVVLDRFVQR